MELIIETGTIVTDANSYATAEQIIAYAEARGITLTVTSPSPGDDEPINIMAIKAMDFLESYRYKFIGDEVEPNEQSLSWPRKNAYVNGVKLPANTIPPQIIRAQCQLCLYVHSGIDLMPASNTETFVKREKIGPIDTEYSEAIEANRGRLPVLPLFASIITPFLRFDAFSVRTVRV